MTLVKSKKWPWQSGLGGANPVPCKWVKQQGLVKGFDFDVTKQSRYLICSSQKNS